MATPMSLDELAVGSSIRFTILLPFPLKIPNWDCGLGVGIESAPQSIEGAF